MRARPSKEALANRSARAFWDVDEDALVLRGPLDYAAELEGMANLVSKALNVLLERQRF